MRFFRFIHFNLLLLALVAPVAAQKWRHEDGEWGETFDMEVIPIHTMLLPSGMVLAYGADNRGKQGGDLYYEVWDVRSGEHTVSGNHNLLRHSTGVDTFCSTLNMDVSTGNIIIMGGDDDDNNGIKDALEFNSNTHKIRKHPKGNMKYARWYGTSINLPNGDIFVVGGESGKNRVTSPIPEVWSRDKGFRALPGAEVVPIRKKSTGAWFYPNAYVNSNGDIILIFGKGKNTNVYRISNTRGNGRIEKIGEKPFESDKLSASMMFDIDQVAMIASDGGLWVVDISDSDKPVFKKRTDLGPGRTNAAMSPLPDGRVAITGGCRSSKNQGNTLAQAVRNVQIWDPATNKVFTGPSQDKARLYHSSGLVLPDGTVFSAGGGAPGPRKQLNGQVYSPGYLFDSKSGELATRPEILECPKRIYAEEHFFITVDDPGVVKKVTALKSGAMTHARNCDARWLDITFSVVNKGKGVIKVSTHHRNIMVPGLWTLHTIDDNGVPSEGWLIHVKP